MTVTWILILAAFLLLVLLAATPFTVRTTCEVDIQGAKFESQVHVLGILFFRMQKSLPFYKEDKAEEAEAMKAKEPVSVLSGAAFILDFWPQARVLSAAFSVLKLRWKTEIGVGDAALTGIMTGFSYLLIGIVTKWLETQIHFYKPPELQVRPYFHEERLQTNLDCIVKSRVGKAIYAAVRVWIWLQRRETRGKPSDSIADVYHA